MRNLIGAVIVAGGVALALPAPSVAADQRPGFAAAGAPVTVTDVGAQRHHRHHRFQHHRTHYRSYGRRYPAYEARPYYYRPYPYYGPAPLGFGLAPDIW